MADRHAAPFRPNLIFDVGMNDGEDTEFYLKKGFDVVAFEANPELIEGAKKTFAKEIRAGRLHIVEGAIVPDPKVKHITFYRYDDRTKWGTIEADVVQSSEKRSTGATEIRVPTVDFAAIIRETGVPYYMKIDIEGADNHCLEMLAGFKAKPAYVSVEAIEQDIGRQETQIELLTSLGYDAFKPVQQARMHRRKLPSPSHEGRDVPHSFKKGSSGPFGSDLEGEWRNADEIRAEYEAIYRRNRRVTRSIFWKRRFTRKPARQIIEWVFNVTIPGWYDTHARHESHGAPDTR